MPRYKKPILRENAEVEKVDPLQKLNDRLDLLIAQLALLIPPPRLSIPTRAGLEIVDPDQLLHARADNNYTELRLIGGKRIVVSRTLKDVAKELPSDRFMRIHAGHVVSLCSVVRYIRGNGGFVMMTDGMQIPVSRDKKDELLMRLGVQ